LRARIRTLPKDSLILYIWQQVLDGKGRLLEAGDVPQDEQFEEMSE